MLSNIQLRKKLMDAQKSGRYMVTITYLDETGKKLDHTLFQERFPNDDVIPSLEQFAAIAMDEQSEVGGFSVGDMQHPQSVPETKEG